MKSIGIFVNKLLTSNETNTSEEVGWTLLSFSTKSKVSLIIV